MGQVHYRKITQSFNQFNKELQADYYRNKSLRLETEVNRLRRVLKRLAGKAIQESENMFPHAPKEL